MWLCSWVDWVPLWGHMISGCHSNQSWCLMMCLHFVIQSESALLHIHSQQVSQREISQITQQVVYISPPLSLSGLVFVS